MIKKNIFMNTVKILGYSERGVINSIVFYLREHPELIGRFIKVLGIDISGDEVEYTLLNEQSFSKYFGTSDLVIIAENKTNNEKTVIFIEGKVKTEQTRFDLDKKFADVFGQLYNKYLLTQLDPTTLTTRIDQRILRLGNNKTVNKAYKDYIANAQRYYFVAILPLDIESVVFQRKFEELSLEGMPIKDIRCAYWGDIEELFIDNPVAANFFYNRGQIY
jgi:hypothetical protein